MSLLEPLTRKQLAKVLIDLVLPLYVALTNPGSTNSQTLSAVDRMQELLDAVRERCK